MATLQIRDFPDPLDQMLQLRARQHHRSLNRQALRSLRKNRLNRRVSPTSASWAG
jgi:plasmid stability protein